MAAAALLLGLAGCGGGSESGCGREIDRDPAVQALQMRILGDPGAQGQYQPALVAARQHAALACLRARGEAPPGGVEGVPRSIGRF